MQSSGAVWREEQTLRMFDLARKLARKESAGRKASVAKEIRELRYGGGDHRHGGIRRRHATTPDIWDGDAMLLATPDGTVDLRTGQLRGEARGLPDPDDGTLVPRREATARCGSRRSIRSSPATAS